tara:strand:+ start:2643 stop:2747 length:105 start_codon:yes stop_codon:yes gene_type:complete
MPPGGGRGRDASIGTAGIIDTTGIGAGCTGIDGA